MSLFRKIIYSLLSVMFCFSLCACEPQSRSESKPFTVNNEIIGSREFIYSKDGLCKFIQTDKNGNELFVIENIDGYTMSGGETDEMNPNQLSVYLCKDGDTSEFIEYLFLDGKIHTKFMQTSNTAGYCEIVKYGKNNKELFSCKVSDDNSGGSIWLDSDTSVRETTASLKTATLKYFDENDGSLLSSELYLYNSDNIHVGHIVFDENGNQIEISLETYLYQYRNYQEITVELIDYNGNSHGTALYKGGYLAD